MIESCRVAFVHDGQLKQNGSPLQDRSFTDMRDSAGQLSGLDPTKLMHGDVRAMVLAMRLRSPKASEILDRIDARFKRSGGDEGLFFDSDPGGTGDEIPLDYYVDAWGTPLEYYATGTRSACTSTTYREAAANFILHKSNLYPVLVSYGPNGPDQLSKEFMDTFGDTTIVGDFWNQPVPSTTQTGLVNHELNHDNIYSVDGLKERLRTGL